MCGKYVFGVITGLAVGSAVCMGTKCMVENSDTAKMKKKAKKLLDKFERCLSESMPFGN